jgi:hypothetical protein
VFCIVICVVVTSTFLCFTKKKARFKKIPPKKRIVLQEMLTATDPTVDNLPVMSPTRGESKLRQITPAETNIWATALCHQSSSNFEFNDLDEPHEYPFKVCYSSFILAHLIFLIFNFNFNYY